MGNLFIYPNEVFVWQITVVVDTSIVFNEIFLGHPLGYLTAVQIGIQHDDRVSKNISRIRIREGVWVSSYVSIGKLQHESVDLLGFTRQTERLKELP